MKKIIVFALLCLAIGATAQAQSRLEHLKIKSQILGVEKDYSIYLPDGYDSSTERYPVLYLLHGAWGNHKSWNRDGGGEQPRITNEQIAKGEAVKMIVVIFRRTVCVIRPLRSVYHWRHSVFRLHQGDELIQILLQILDALACHLFF